jgi:DNA replication protein DnaC
MNTEQTITALRKLRLHGMADRYYEFTKLPAAKQLDAHTLIGMLAEAEADYKQKARFANLIKQANLRFIAFPEDIECSKERGLEAELWLVLCEGKYLKDAQNILLTGPTGSGKSFTACALGYKAAMLGHKVQYVKLSKFTEIIRRAKIEGNYLKLADRLSKMELLILDDWGLDSLDREMCLSLYEILDERFNRVPTIITSQYPVSHWYDFIKDVTLSEAILDRLINNAVNITLKGESRRKKNKSMK